MEEALLAEELVHQVTPSFLVIYLFFINFLTILRMEF
jgi:hypothetical protein